MSSRTRTSQQSRFSTIPGPSVPRSVFNRSHGHKTTMDAGVLVPIFVDEALPGDTMSMRAHHFGRIATLIQPIMDNVYVDTHFFAIPYRLVWDNWKRFMGEQDNPADSTDFVIPTRVTGGGTGALEGTTEDYMGIPTRVPTLRFNNLPFRAMNLVWNEFFRDENLQDSVAVPKDDGPDTLIQFPLLPRGKRHDYMTACLPWPQKGAAVEIPLGGLAPVSLDTAINVQGSGSPQWNNTSGSAYYLHLYDNSNEVFWDRTASTTSTDDRATWGSVTGLTTVPTNDVGTADLSAVNAITVNAMRESVTLQQMLEKDARGGSRYTEIVRSHFGVISPDARLQRPEYLGGNSLPLNVHAVANTSGSTGNQADLAAFGTIAGRGAGFRKSFTEHCIILGFCSIRADINYQQGLERMWNRSTRYDFYWPTLANLGEQAVLNKEIYAQGSVDPAADDQVFGYQERYGEYRYKPNRISGEFRSSSPTSLDVWHLAQEFGSLPVLDETFIVEKPPIDRVVAVPSEPHFLMDFHFDYSSARPMPTNSVPGLKRF